MFPVNFPIIQFYDPRDPLTHQVRAAARRKDVHVRDIEDMGNAFGVGLTGG